MRALIMWSLIGLFLFSDVHSQPVLNGFVLSDLRIPVDQIRRGGPPKDGIPSIDRPGLVNASAAHLNDQDPIMGVVWKGHARAYPISILNWHEIVNDNIDGVDILVSYCPLCGSGVVFESGDLGDFGVSGLLYNSDVLMYDRKTQSLWSQLMSRAVSGPLSGTKLQVLQSRTTTWVQWKTDFPDTQVLSRQTGHYRDYDRDPYEGYGTFDQIMFPVANVNKELANKEKVLGVEVNGRFKAYPLKALPKKQGTLEDTFAGTQLKIRYDKESNTAWISSPPEISGTLLYWFAWYAFHPSTAVYPD